MFSTLLGALPPDPDHATASVEDRIRHTLADLETTGLELLADGESLDLETPPSPDAVVESWRRAAAATERPVKAVLPGPYSAARSGGAGRVGGAGGRSAAVGVRSAMAWAEALQPAISALAEAGCPFVEIDEPDVLAISVVASEKARFIDAHRRLTDGIAGIHLSLALTGGNLDAAGPATFFDHPYASYAFDLIAGPDNWRLIVAAPGDRGIVAGALSAQPVADKSPEVLVWAAHYAASTNGRGVERVGLANASSLAGLSRGEALVRLAIVADAARLAAIESPDELARVLDPRATLLPPTRRRGA
jgi:methionine synthase II (cobalamin-independent)